MIPGPIEFTPEVLAATGQPTTSHVAPSFIAAFGEALERMRQVFGSPSGQPFILAGSGTLAMDSTAANLTEPGDRALVVNTGYFSDRFTAILRRYGAEVTEVKAPRVGDAPSVQQVRRALEMGPFKLMTLTHVDTSTAVRLDVRSLAAIGREHGTLVVVDGVCSVGGEELDQDGWGVDLVLTASQKAVGVPPGLALIMAGPRAIEAFARREAPVGSYYGDWTEWLPIMKAYEARAASYFGTPAVNLVWALRTSLEQIVSEGLTARAARHRRMAGAFRAATGALGLALVPVRPELYASTLTGVYYPESIDATLVGRAAEEGVILAGGLHPEIRTRYFRVGHMGAVTEADIYATVGAIEKALARGGRPGDSGAGLAAAARSLQG